MSLESADRSGVHEGDDAFLRRCFQEALSPKLKLFLSADIVGSTQFKQPLIAQNASGRDWSRYIKQFYDRMQEGFFAHWKEAIDLIDQHGKNSHRLFSIYAGARPCRWKTVGDEILFWKVLGHENQIWLTLDAWLERFPHDLIRQGFPSRRRCDSDFLLVAGGQHGWHERFHRIFGTGSLQRLMAA